MDWVYNTYDNADSNSFQLVRNSIVFEKRKKCERNISLILAYILNASALLYRTTLPRREFKLHERFQYSRLGSFNRSWNKYSAKPNNESESCSLWGTSKVDSPELFPISHLTAYGCYFPQHRIHSALDFRRDSDLQCQLLQVGNWTEK